MEAAYYWILPVIKTSQITPGQCLVSDMWAAIKARGGGSLVHGTEERKYSGLVKKRLGKTMSSVDAQCVPKHMG